MENQSVVDNSEPKKKSNRTLIIVVAIVLLCCCFVVVAAAVVFMLNGSGSIGLPSYSGLADAELRTDTMKLIGQQEAATGCDNFSLSSAEVVNPPQADAGGVWTEMWQISGCGESHLYAVTFSPDPAGGTNIYALRAD